MSRDLNKKEEKFKELLDNLEIDLNTDVLWSDLSQQVPKKKKRFGWMFFSFLLLGLVLTGLLTREYFTTNQISNFENISRNANSPKDKTYETQSKTTIKNKTSPISDEHNTKINIVSAENESFTNSSDLTNHETYIIANNLGSTNATNIDFTQASPVQSEINSIVANDNIINTINSNFSLNKNQGMIFERPQKALASNEFISIKSIESIILSNSLDRRDNIFDDSRITNSITPVQRDNWKKFLNIHVGLNQNLSSNTINFNPENIDSRVLGLENDKLGFNSTLSAGLVHRTGWRISAGLNYSTFFSSINSESVEIATSEVTGTETIIINPDGSQTLIEGMVNQTMTTESTFLWHRRHKRINAQVSLGKTVFNWNKFSIGLDAGINYNIWASDKGYFFDNQLKFTKISEGSETPYKQNHGIGVTTGVTINYQLDKFSFGINPFLRYNPNSISKASHIYSNKNNQIGLNASLFYLFD